MIEDDGLIVAESGAITEYLIDKYSDGKLAPKRGTKEYVEYLQWIHFAESSAIFPLLLKIFVEKEGRETNFLAGYANIEIEKVLSFLDDSLEGKSYLVGDSLTGADTLNSFIVEIVKNNGEFDKYKNIAAYAPQLSTHPAFIKADQIELKAEA